MNVASAVRGLVLCAVVSLAACSFQHHQRANDLTDLYDRQQGNQSRGEQLATMMCAGCHYNAADQALSGKQLTDLPIYMGRIYSANITNGEAGIKNYPRAALAQLIRTGTRLNGSVSPFMGVPQISDSDLAHLLDFLQSDHPLVRPAPRPSQQSRFSWLSRLYLGINPVQAKVPVQQNPGTVDTTDVERGRYLVAILECYGCHSRNIAAADRQSPEKTPGYMAGGARLVGADGQKIRSANLTPDHSTGIGHWTAQQFADVMRDGVRVDGSPLRAPMPRYPHLSDAELTGIFAYLMSLAPVINP